MPPSPNLHRGITFRIKTPEGWHTHVLPSTLEGRPYYWALHPLTAEQRARNSPLNANGLPGEYRAVFTLAKPGYALQAVGEHSTEAAIEGDSNLYIGREFADVYCLRMKVDGRDFEVRFTPNSHGRLGKLVLDSVHADDFSHARRLGWAAVSPTLSLLSATLDIPLHVSQVDLTELRSQAVAGAIVVDYVDVGLWLAALNGLSDEFRHYASMYREALNSNSPNYEFLCLFKIIESIKSRRERLAREAKERGEEPRRVPERFPEQIRLVDWLDSLLPPTAKREWSTTDIAHTFPAEILGKRFGRIIEDHLRPLRNRIAHGLLDTGELGASIDDIQELTRIQQWIPATKYLVRQMLKNEFPTEYLLDGTDVPETDDLNRQARTIWSDEFAG